MVLNLFAMPWLAAANAQNFGPLGAIAVTLVILLLIWSVRRSLFSYLKGVSVARRGDRLCIRGRWLPISVVRGAWLTSAGIAVACSDRPPSMGRSLLLVWYDCSKISRQHALYRGARSLLDECPAGKVLIIPQAVVREEDLEFLIGAINHLAWLRYSEKDLANSEPSTLAGVKQSTVSAEDVRRGGELVEDGQTVGIRLCEGGPWIRGAALLALLMRSGILSTLKLEHEERPSKRKVEVDSFGSEPARTVVDTVAYRIRTFAGRSLSWMLGTAVLGLVLLVKVGCQQARHIGDLVGEEDQNGSALGLLILVAGALILAVVLRNAVPQARRIESSDIEDLQLLDGVAFGVYLRSFSADSHVVAGGGPNGAGRTSAAARSSVNGRFATVEERSLEAVAEEFPLVAIGRPGERLPSLGALRYYVPEGQAWQRVVTRLISEAELVILNLGESDGVLWEFWEALTLLSPSRLLLVMDMSDELYADTSREMWLRLGIAMPEHNPEVVAFTRFGHPYIQAGCPLMPLAPGDSLSEFDRLVHRGEPFLARLSPVDRTGSMIDIG